ncbi:MAG: DUF1553 domain-containing protein [Pirellulaceae bacterium]|nr:DUF1553 domain-containing protein [Pirellulaceae bacterium]
MDHEGLTALSSAGGERRLLSTRPAESLVLRKPLLQVDHEGGQRFAAGSWEHQLLLSWIAAGAPGAGNPQVLAELRVEPAEVLFSQGASPVQLRVTAIWQTGNREDVTPLCRFRSNDDSIAKVSADGVVHSTGVGDSHVVVFYDNGVKAVPVLRPFEHRASSEAMRFRSRAEEPPEGIDQFIEEKLAKLHLFPSELCSDEEFLRRASLDLAGTLPTPAEIRRFVSDGTGDKRRQKIDELLDRPAYAAWWANKLCDFTGCNPAQQAELGQETSVQWYMWMYQRLRDNVSYDELARRIVLASSREPGQSYNDYAQAMSSYLREVSPADFAQRETMPHYWTRRGMQKPEEASQAFAHSFLGIRLQCAQCHKHPFAPWTRQDFQNFSRFFQGMKFGVPGESRQRYRELAAEAGLSVRGDEGAPISNEVLKQARRGRTIPWRELYFDPPAETRSLDLLRSGPVSLGRSQDPREPIMAWMRAPDNPWFARAFVNRVWAAYFHRGLVEPPDDLNPANPASHPELLDWLATSFIEQGMDMKWLHRTITSSHAYQRSWVPNETNREDRRNYSRMIPRRMPAEVIYDGVKQSLAATESDEEVRTDLSRRAIGHLSMRLAGTYAMQVFGKPDRAVNCDCERVNQPSLLQAIFLQNDPLMDDRLNESGWLRSLEQQRAAGTLPSGESLIREAWLRTLSREPAPEEVIRAEKHLAEAESPVEGVRDLLWALLNTKEFVLIK